jgi:hypothetical protein
METEFAQRLPPISHDDVLKERKKTPQEDKENKERKQKDKKISDVALTKISKKKNFYSDFVIKKDIDPRILAQKIFSKK